MEEYLRDFRSCAFRFFGLIVMAVVLFLPRAYHGFIARRHETMLVSDAQCLRSVSVSKRWRSVALAGISFRVGAGEIVSLIGRNGAGKTTCLNLIYRLFTGHHGISGVPKRRHTDGAARDRQAGLIRTFQKTMC